MKSKVKKINKNDPEIKFSNSKFNELIKDTLSKKN